MFGNVAVTLDARGITHVGDLGLHILERALDCSRRFRSAIGQ
jgi:hypothetical protein